MLNNAALKGLEGLEKLALKPVKIDVAGLKPSDFKGNWKICQGIPDSILHNHR